MMDFSPPPKREPQYIPRAPQPGPNPGARPARPLQQLQPEQSYEPQKPTSAPKKTKRGKKSKSGLLLKSLVVVSLILISVSGFLAYNYYNTKKQLDAAAGTTSVVGSSETDKLITEISKTVELPSGETPTLTTLKNINITGSNDYLKVQNGDKVLVYTNAGVAVFYRPSLKKVIFFTYLSANSSNASSQQPANSTSDSDTIPTTRPTQTPAQ